MNKSNFTFFLLFLFFSCEEGVLSESSKSQNSKTSLQPKTTSSQPTTQSSDSSQVSQNSQRFDVTFHANNNAEVSIYPLIFSVKKGDKVAKPNDPARDDHTFGGWYKEDSFVNLFDFDNEVITQNITLYAKWNSSFTFGQYISSKSFSVSLEKPNGITYVAGHLYVSDQKKRKVLAYSLDGNSVSSKDFDFNGLGTDEFSGAAANRHTMSYINNLFYLVVEEVGISDPFVVVFDSAGTRKKSKEFSFNANNDEAHGIDYYQDHFYITDDDPDSDNVKMFAYDKDGSYDSAQSYVTTVSSFDHTSRGIVFHNDKLYILAKGGFFSDDTIYVYQSEKEVAKFLLNGDNINPRDIAYHNGFVYVTDLTKNKSKVYVYYVGE